MKLPKLPISKKTLKSAANVAAPVAIGMAAAKLGGALVKRAPFGIGAKASEVASTPMGNAAVEVGGGLLVDAALLLLGSKLKLKPISAGAAPFLIAGTAVAAGAPVAAPMLMAQVDRAADALFGAGAPAALPENVTPLRQLKRAANAGAGGDWGYGDNVDDVTPGGVPAFPRDAF